MNRLQLHEKLVDLLGSRNVYFQPPPSLQMNFPCFVYERASGLTEYAEDMPYKYNQSYNITYVSKDPDTEVMLKKIAMGFPMIRYNRHYTANNLNHDTFILYT